MMRAPTDTEILLAEQRLADARHALSSSASKARAAFLEALVKPGTLLAIAGGAGLLGYTVFKRPSPLMKSTSSAPSATATAATAAAASTSLVGIIMAFAMRYAVRQMSGIGLGLFQQVLRQNSRMIKGRGSASAVRPEVTLH